MGAEDRLSLFRIPPGADIVDRAALGYKGGATTEVRAMKAVDCTTMAEIRAEIDRVDRELVALFAERTGYIDRAAAVKTGIGLPARITERVEEVVANVRAEAVRHALPPDTLEKLWRKLIDWSIAREEDVLGPESRTKTPAIGENDDGQGN